MIPEDFKDYFINATPSVQPTIVSILLELSTSDSTISDSSE